ncbi:hypothetical protein SIN8267_00956 [Sinobacterium norvegicum]|uniref:NnrU domain-containing protein n=1 Tax=Sinobacterium norvegicum TaxID=1641715 RepID=A0ABM9ACC3_9GAMM|nr:NnrU family protein [Sinobacterium norvegicum]CAH0990856.1 hypothetical protein SIN8267_00956 [Sinobacterium norvegicum]
MAFLISGIVLWSLVHFIPSIGLSLKTAVINRLGSSLYAAMFSLLLLLSLALIIFGWRDSVPQYIYSPLSAAKPVAMLLLVITFLLFGAAKHQTRIKRVIRHPQLASIVTWSTAHLLLNGDSRSVVLFSGLGCWALLEMIFINRREGEWIKPDSPSWKVEIKGGLISLAILAVVIFLHPYIAGVPVH